MNYLVHEQMYTFQGEGLFMGVPAYFIRLHGCPLHCSFCDSAGTWHPDYIPDHIARVSSYDLAENVRKSGASICVVTGGEPAIHDLTSLTRELDRVGINAHLETSGAFPIKGHFKFITVSPKKAKLPLISVLRQASEIKLIIDTIPSIYYWIEFIFEHLSAKEVPTVWLHPEWSQHRNPTILNAISNAVKGGGGKLRAGWQIHKNYSVDTLDPGSRKLVPLGGRPEQGF